MRHCPNCGHEDPHGLAQPEFFISSAMDAGTPVYDTLAREINYDPRQHPERGPANRLALRHQPRPKQSRADRRRIKQKKEKTK